MHPRISPRYVGLALLLRCSSLSADVITGADQGSGPVVKVFSGATGAELETFNAYQPVFTGGVRVASGDVNNDGVADVITGAGPGAGPHINVFDGSSNSLLMSFFAYTPSFAGGVFVAAGDVNGDGAADIITGAGLGGGPHVKVFSGQTGNELSSFFAYSTTFSGGVSVAAGDVNGDGVDDIITGSGPGGPPHVKVFDGATNAELRSLFAYPEFSAAAGVFVASGDIDGDGYAEIVTGRDAGEGLVKVFSGQTGDELLAFNAFAPGFTGGVRVAVGDVDGDGAADIITGAGPGGGPHVKVFSGSSGAELSSYFAYDPGFSGGVFVAAVSRPIPKPNGWALLALGGSLVGWRRRT